jgi:hypothetical protein
VTEYRIFFVDGRSADVSAARVYFGWKRFYLYDENASVVGSFGWEQLVGFQTISSPVQQIILQDHDDLPHNRKSNTEDKEAALKKQKGEYLYEMEGLTEQLSQVSRRLSNAWLMADAYRRTKTNELMVLLENSKAEVQKIQAKLTDIQKEMDERMKRLLEQISRGLKGDFKL